MPLKGIRIAVTSMLARATLQRQALAQKGGDMRGDQGHGMFSSTKRSQTWAMSPISCGERSKYQKVLLTWAWPRYVIKANVWRPIWSRPSGLVSSTLDAKVCRKSMSRSRDRSSLRGRPADARRRANVLETVVRCSGRPRSETNRRSSATATCVRVTRYCSRAARVGGAGAPNGFYGTWGSRSICRKMYG
jgi:hypothetical protein